MTSFSWQQTAGLLIVVATAVLLGACGDDTTGAAGPTANETGGSDGSGTRTVAQETGEVEIPTDAERIVALDEYAAVNLLAVGVTPQEAFAFFEDAALEAVLESEGIEVRPTSEPNLEAIAATDPDLIVFTSEAETLELYDEFSAIAPTVVIPFDQPWQEVVRFTGKAFGREGRADDLVGAVERRCERLGGQLENPPPSLSVLGYTGDNFYTPAPQVPMSRVIEECGFTRPPAQTSGEVTQTIIVLSPEVLAEHDADTVAVLGGSGYNADAVADIPTFRALPAVQDGRTAELNGDIWFGNHPFAIYWMIADLELIPEGGSAREELGTPDDAVDRWAAFDELLE